MDSITSSIKTSTDLPPLEDFAKLTSLDYKISSIVVSYLFDVDTSFGCLFPALIKQSKDDFAEASKRIHSSKIRPTETTESYPIEAPQSYPRQGGVEYFIAPDYCGVSSFFLEHMRSQNEGTYFHLDIGGGSGDFAQAWKLQPKRKATLWKVIRFLLPTFEQKTLQLKIAPTIFVTLPIF